MPGTRVAAETHPFRSLQTGWQDKAFSPTTVQKNMTRWIYTSEADRWARWKRGKQETVPAVSGDGELCRDRGQRRDPGRRPNCTDERGHSHRCWDWLRSWGSLSSPPILCLQPSPTTQGHWVNAVPTLPGFALLFTAPEVSCSFLTFLRQGLM